MASLYAQVAPGVLIGNLESVDDLLASYAANIDKAPLTEVTAVVNLSTISINKDRFPEEILYISQAQTPDEPYDGSFERVAAAMMKVIDVLIVPMIRNGHTVLLVCESGRRVSAMVAVFYMVSTVGGDSQKIYDSMVYAHVSARDRERHSQIHATNESRRWDDSAEALSRADKEFYDNLQQTRICLSPQYKKLLLYHIGTRTK